MSLIDIHLLKIIKHSINNIFFLGTKKHCKGVADIQIDEVENKE